MKRLIGSIGSVVAVLGLIGCAAPSSTDGVIVRDGREWLCELSETAVVCTAGMRRTDGEDEAYVCMHGEERAECPPAEALDSVEGLDALLDVLERAGVALEITDIPWACLLTGEHQRHCTLEVGMAVEIAGRDGDGDRDPSLPPDDGAVGPAPIPRDCSLTSWEAFFCGHSTFSYQASGVPITFPCDIFHADRTLDEFADTTERLGAQGARAASTSVSCHAGEWLMRDTAWITAVLTGCLTLSDAILTMCQQAADYAPSTGMCSPTGTW